MWEILKLDRNTTFGTGTSSGTELIHLPRSNMIGMIYLTVRATNGSGSNAADDAEQQTVQESLSRIEIMANGESIKRYNGYDCRSIATYNMGRLPPEKRTQVGAAVQESMFPIYFNTDLADRNTIFPAPLCDSLDMEIEYNFTEDTDAGFAATGFTYDLYMYVLPPDGDMQNKDIILTKYKDRYTTTAAGIKKFDLTLNKTRRLSRVYMDIYEVLIAEGVDVTDVELKVNGNTMMNCKWSNLQQINALDRKLKWNEQILIEANSTTDVIETRIPNLREHDFASYAATNRDDTEYISVAPTADSITLAQTNEASGALSISSDVIPAFVVLDFDRAEIGEGISQNVNTLELLLNDAAAGASVRILEESIAKKWF